MYPTIIFFFALFQSIALFTRVMNGINKNAKTSNVDVVLYMTIPILWSWLFYLLH